MGEAMVRLYNEESLPLEVVSVVDFEQFRHLILGTLAGEAHLSALFGVPQDRGVRLYAVVSDTVHGSMGLAATDVGDSFPSLTPACPQAHWFEREIFEQWGVRPEGHPWLKPVRFQPPRRGTTAPSPPGVTDYFSMEGEEVHEVAVGPVHAGVIEPGHFRFQCYGETVHHLEISLGYQHRGVEAKLVGGPDRRTIHYMETLAGDTTIGHATAYSQAVESLAGRRPTMTAQILRGVAAELERLANHIGCLGAMAGDIAFLPTRNFCGRIRGDVLNLTALICGNRFGRGFLRPGGVTSGMDPDQISRMLARLDVVEKDAEVALSLMFDAPSVLGRLEGTGTVPAQTAASIGMVGVGARASGLARDVRSQLPYGIYRYSSVPVCTYTTGDCFARAYVRWVEIQRSFAFVRDQLGSLNGDGFPVKPLYPGAGRLTVSLVEGWRGEICHVAATDAAGKFLFYKVVDPSFHNWFGLACALRGQQISDFPLCNKSFDLSYCGHDL
ncbi:NADH-quinone oxidoreductase subunit C [bacterium]|nr:NADH-quinone oxidoreductase subunit C [bacterium]